MPDIPRLPWYETPIWLVVQLAEIVLLTGFARAIAPGDLSTGAAIWVAVGILAVVFAANLLALRWLRARHTAG